MSLICSFSGAWSHLLKVWLHRNAVPKNRAHSTVVTHVQIWQMSCCFGGVFRSLPLTSGHGQTLSRWLLPLFAEQTFYLHTMKASGNRRCCCFCGRIRGAKDGLPAKAGYGTVHLNLYPWLSHILFSSNCINLPKTNLAENLAVLQWGVAQGTVQGSSWEARAAFPHDLIKPCEEMAVVTFTGILFTCKSAFWKHTHTICKKVTLALLTCSRTYLINLWNRACGATEALLS